MLDVYVYKLFVFKRKTALRLFFLTYRYAQFIERGLQIYFADAILPHFAG